MGFQRLKKKAKMMKNKRKLLVDENKKENKKENKIGRAHV